MEEIKAGVKVIYKGKEYETGNRRHSLVEIYKDGKFYKVVSVNELTKTTKQ